jgi:vitamin B12 transporter
MPALPIDTTQIVITASRAPESEAQTPASVTVIDKKRIERLGDPLAATLLRLTPSVAITTIGPAGSLTEVRIRGAEANHTLLFIDGIKVNDPAAGDTPRFELLNADIASRIEVVRGPQSAIWGSEAIGGVIAVNGTTDAAATGASLEGGSLGFERANATTALQFDKMSLAGAVGWQRATGINSFGVPGGDRDGYRNLSARLRGTVDLTPDVRVGATGLALTGRSEFDGFDPLTGAHQDTLDNSRNSLGAGRLWVDLGSDGSSWSGRVSGTYLTSSNRNYVADESINRTRGTRRTIDAQAAHRFSTGKISHDLIIAGETERETFRAHDTIYGGATDQDRTRHHNSLTVEWRAEAPGFTGDVAARRDAFDRFKDATSLRASLLAPLGSGFSLAGSYAEGISQPTFFDLYGFFPGSFAGNPSLKPESSRGFEGSLRFRGASIEAALTGYRQRLDDEIVDVFDPVTFVSTTTNRDTTSHRWGVESQVGWQVADRLRLTANYSFLHATQPDALRARQVTELRRPKHSGSVAADGTVGRWSYGASLSYVGAHFDIQDNYPYGTVRLRAYWLAGARLAYRMTKRVEVFVRGSNLLNVSYEDSAGYHTERRGIFAGIRLANL